jgi:hypothetical protein
MTNQPEMLNASAKRQCDQNDDLTRPPREGLSDTVPLLLLLANAETNEANPGLREEFVSISSDLGLRLGLVEQDGAVGAVLRQDGSAALWAALDPDGPDGEAFVDLGCPPDAKMVRLINIVIGAPAEALHDGDGEDRVFRYAPDGALRFGFGDDVDLFPGDARGVDLHGALRLSLSPSTGCWFIAGEEAGR